MEKRNLVEKKIHEEKAYKIVSDLAVETIDEKDLISLVKYIEPYHYEEIVEERFLSKLCGYPLCSSQLKKIPSHKKSFFVFPFVTENQLLVIHAQCRHLHHDDPSM